MSISTNAGFLDSVPIGCGMDWFTNTAPDNWMLCQGQAISRTDYSELFAIIGTTYGVGNGSTTFNLPDFRGRTGVGKSGSGTFNTLGTKTGAETVTLTTEQIPAHKHPLNDPGHVHHYSTENFTGASDFDRTHTGTGLVSEFQYTAATTKSYTGITMANAGGGQAHNNIQPSLVINKIIKVK